MVSSVPMVRLFWRHWLATLIQGFASMKQALKPCWVKKHVRQMNFFPGWPLGGVKLTCGLAGTEERRRFISRVVPAYRQRGTKAGLIEVLVAYSGITERESVTIREFTQPFEIGVTSTVGVDTMVGSGPPTISMCRLSCPMLAKCHASAVSRSSVRSSIRRSRRIHTTI